MCSEEKDLIALGRFVIMYQSGSHGEELTVLEQNERNSTNTQKNKAFKSISLSLNSGSITFYP